MMAKGATKMLPNVANAFNKPPSSSNKFERVYSIL